MQEPLQIWPLEVFGRTGGLFLHTKGESAHMERSRDRVLFVPCRMVASLLDSF